MSISKSIANILVLALKTTLLASMASKASLALCETSNVCCIKQPHPSHKHMHTQTQTHLIGGHLYVINGDGVADHDGYIHGGAKHYI